MGLFGGWDPIEISMDPELGRLAGLLLTWHGVFTAIGIAVGVWVAVQFAKRVGFIEDISYTIALVGVPAGIIGARALYVIENRDLFGGSNWPDIFAINEGGISIYGALIGGVLGALLYNRFGILPVPFLRRPVGAVMTFLFGWMAGGRITISPGPRMPLGPGLDAAAFGMILGQGIGRIGDIINGEHFAKTTDLPWAVVYTHSNSPSFGRDPQQPAVGYEFIGDALIFLVLLGLRRFYKKDGLLFFSYAFLYSLMRLGVSALRLDSNVLWEFKMAQVVALAIIAISVLGFTFFLTRPPAAPEAVPGPGPVPAPAAGGASARR